MKGITGGSMVNKLAAIANKHNFFIVTGGSTLARGMEQSGGDIGGAISFLAEWFTNFNVNNIVVGPSANAYGALGEFLLTLTHPDYLVDKLLFKDHLYSWLVKIGAGVKVVSEVGLLDKKWGNLGWKTAKNAAIASLFNAGSSPFSKGATSFMKQAPAVEAGYNY